MDPWAGHGVLRMLGPKAQARLAAHAVQLIQTAVQGQHILAPSAGAHRTRPAVHADARVAPRFAASLAGLCAWRAAERVSSLP